MGSILSVLLFSSQPLQAVSKYAQAFPIRPINAFLSLVSVHFHQSVEQIGSNALHCINGIRSRLAKRFSSCDIHFSWREMAKELKIGDFLPIDGEHDWVIGVKILVDAQDEFDVAGQAI